MEIRSGCCNELLIETDGSFEAWKAHLNTPGVDVRSECPNCGSIRCLTAGESAIGDVEAQGWDP